MARTKKANLKARKHRKSSTRTKSRIGMRGGSLKNIAMRVGGKLQNWSYKLLSVESQFKRMLAKSGFIAEGADSAVDIRYLKDYPKEQTRDSFKSVVVGNTQLDTSVPNRIMNQTVMKKFYDKGYLGFIYRSSENGKLQLQYNNPNMPSQTTDVVDNDKYSIYGLNHSFPKLKILVLIKSGNYPEPQPVKGVNISSIQDATVKGIINLLQGKRKNNSFVGTTTSITNTSELSQQINPLEISSLPRFINNNQPSATNLNINKLLTDEERDSMNSVAVFIKTRSSYKLLYFYYRDTDESEHRLSIGNMDITDKKSDITGDKLNRNIFQYINTGMSVKFPINVIYGLAVESNQ